MSLQRHTKVSFILSPNLALHGVIVISKLKMERGLALQDLLTGAYEYLETIDLKPHARIYLLDHLATTE
jgi:hypothetical protein